MLLQARRYPVPWPLHDVAWGPSPRLYQCGLDPVNQSGPVIVTWGGKKVVYFEKAIDVMLMFQVFDAGGNQLDHKVSPASTPTTSCLWLLLTMISRSIEL